MKTLDLKTQTLVLTKMGFVYIYIYVRCGVSRVCNCATVLWHFISHNAEGFEPDVHTWAAWNLE